MPNVDLPLSKLRNYKPELTLQPEFESFWDAQRKASSEQPLNARMTRIDYPAKHVEVYEIAYDGIDGTPIHVWYILPAKLIETRPLPIVVEYHGTQEIGDIIPTCCIGRPWVWRYSLSIHGDRVGNHQTMQFIHKVRPWGNSR